MDYRLFLCLKWVLKQLRLLEN
uniref:Uncharacterized protein n=1 Tax=Arundo donax TaxID=35708 RepID=A0A0A9BL91_ARUDO